MVKTSITAAFSRTQPIISQKLCQTELRGGEARRVAPRGPALSPARPAMLCLPSVFFFFCLCLRRLCSGLTGATHSHEAVNEWPHSVRSSKRMPECCPTLSVCHLKKKKKKKVDLTSPVLVPPPRPACRVFLHHDGHAAGRGAADLQRADQARGGGTGSGAGLRVGDAHQATRQQLL